MSAMGRKRTFVTRHQAMTRHTELACHGLPWLVWMPRPASLQNGTDRQHMGHFDLTPQSVQMSIARGHRAGHSCTANKIHIINPALVECGANCRVFPCPLLGEGVIATS